MEGGNIVHIKNVRTAGAFPSFPQLIHLLQQALCVCEIRMVISHILQCSKLQHTETAPLILWGTMQRIV